MTFTIYIYINIYDLKLMFSILIFLGFMIHFFLFD